MKKTEKTVALLFFLTTHLVIAQPIIRERPTFLFEEATIQSVQTAIKHRQLTCEQLVNFYIDRIKKYNLSVSEKAPLNAIARINPNAIDQAQALDVAFAAGQWKGPLHCVPILLKDNIDSYDSISSSGSLSLLGNQPVTDAFLVKQLRDAGAVILGKGTMDEFASGVSGISSANGRVGNAYDATKNPGGSSSGVAVAVSANFALAGIGTDNSGSVRIPSAFNGVIGLRPTMGLVSQQGIFPRGNLDGTAGPITRTAEDLALILDVIAQTDASDKKTQKISRPSTYTSYLDEDALQGKRVGVISHLDKLDVFEKMPEEVDQDIQNTLETMRKMGAIIVPNISLRNINLDRQYNQAGEREEVNAYLASYPAVRTDYYDICESERAPIFGTSYDCMQFVRALPKKFSKEYYQALNTFSKNSLYIKDFMNSQHVDVLLVPVSITGSATYNSKAMITESIASNAGLPSITFPIGYTKKDHMPIGIELIGREFSEGTLISMAYAYEQYAKTRVPPTMPIATSVFDTMNIEKYNNYLMRIGYDAYQSILSICTPGHLEKCLNAKNFYQIVKKNNDALILKNTAYSNFLQGKFT